MQFGGNTRHCFEVGWGGSLSPQDLGEEPVCLSKPFYNLSLVKFLTRLVQFLGMQVIADM